MSRESASLPGAFVPPRYWEKRIAAAYLRMMGLTQGDAAKAVGRHKRRLAEWESEKETWALAREEAKKRWLGEVGDAARKTLLTAIREGMNGFLALQVLERLDEDLAPPKQRVDVALEGAGMSALLIAARTTGQALGQALPGTMVIANGHTPA